MKETPENQKYIFVGYSHRNEDTVQPIIEALEEAGFRLWYDDSVESASEWPAYIEEKLTGCEVFLALLSNDAVDSLNCRNEIGLALSLKKKILAVYLAETTLRHGLALQLGNVQALELQKFATVEEFYKKLFSLRVLQLCREKPLPELPLGASAETVVRRGKNGELRLALADETIIDLYWQRNERAIDETDYKYRKFLYAIAYNIVHDNSDCEECLSDTYLGTWNRIPPQRPTKFRAFLARIMRNVAVDKYRYNSAKRRIPSELTVSLDELDDCITPGPSAEEEAIINELTRILNDFIRALPEKKELIFVCRYYFADKVQDIAKLIRQSPSTVNRELAAIRRELKEILIKEGFYEEE